MLPHAPPPPGAGRSRPTQHTGGFTGIRGRQRIVDQAKARGNARDTGGVPDHRAMGPNSTIAEGMKVSGTDDGDS